MKWRNLSLIVLDASLAGGSFLAALYLRWADAMWHHAAGYWLQGSLLCAGIAAGFILLTRLYRRLWRYVSLKDLMTIAKITLATLVCFYALMFLVMRLEMLPRSVPVIHALVLLAAFSAPRVLTRAFIERRLQLPATQQVPVMLVGATAEAELFIRESLRSPSFAYRVVGIAATDAAGSGRNLHHVRVYGGLADVPAIIRKLKRKGLAPQRLILADAALSGEQIRILIAQAEAEGLACARMPRLTDLQRGDEPIRIRPIDVEDVLGRPQATLDWDAMRAVVAGKHVLITGAGGSIGSELVRQVAGFSPASLTLLDASEYQLYLIDREMQERFATLPRTAVLRDVRDVAGMMALLKSQRFDVVFHAAALKHVPLCEANIAEAVLTNISGTQVVADGCVAANVPLMVQISTDKAVNPTNVMGACKRVGESYAQGLGQAQHITRFVTVRFGNVLGSTGSVVPLFQHQLQQGGPLTVTHPDMTRYFMTIGEAVQLVIQSAALALADGSQRAPIYVLDMGQPVKIDDLARQMIRLAGLRPDADIAIHYTGLRPGEKLVEELFYDTEPLLGTSHAAIHLAAAREVAIEPLRRQLAALHELALARNDAATLALLRQLVPEYQADERMKAKAI